MNTLLCFVGIYLIGIILRGREKNLSLVRLVLISYFLVALQYNQERIFQFPNYVLLASAAFILIYWSYRTWNEVEEVVE